jgi:tetratricopeptide (TPR) repeat protein
MKSFLQVLLMTFALPAAAQSQTNQIRATAEYRAAAGETAETARQMALVEARRKVLRDAATQLQGTAEVKAVPLKANQIDAFLPAILQLEEEVAAGTIHRANVLARLNPPQIARRLDQLRKDSTAAAGMMEMWKLTEELYPQLAHARDRERLTARLNATNLVAHVYASLAKTEESPASARVTSAAGRQRALQLAQSALARGTGWPETHVAMGDALMSEEQDSAAEVEYRKALLLNPASPSIHVKLAEALRLGNKEPEALAELREALRIDPKSAVAHAELGYLLEDQGNRAEGIAEYREAIRLDPDFIEAHNYLAIALSRSGKIPEAVAEFREMIRIDPDSVLGHYNLGIAVADMDLDDESAEAFRNALRVNPNHFNARFNIGELLRLEGKLDEAVKQFREYLRLAPNTPQNQRSIRRAREFVQTHENP